MANQDKKTDDDSKNDKSSESTERSTVTNQGATQERLGFGLRSMYRSVLEEPLPDDMMALLDQLGEDDDDSNGEKPAKSGRNS